MDAGMLLGQDSRWPLALIVLAGLLTPPGCSNSASESPPKSESEPAPYAASGGLPTVDVGQGEPPSAAGDQTAVSQPAANVAPAAPLQLAPGDSTSIGEASRPNELKADLSAAKLSEFLSGADKDMETIMSGRSGITDQNQAREELLRIIRLKLEASRRLIQHADAGPAMRSEGARGELEALSHLAAFGDLKSAVELETLAKNNLQGDDPQLAADCRLVLIGFAIESLQNGEATAAQRIVDLVDGFTASAHSPDVPALMVMGQARQMLGQFGYDEQAKKIRDKILDLYADASDPRVAEMAAQVAGNVQYDGIEALRAAATSGTAVSTEEWTESVEALIAESPDLQTIQYLAGAALEFESLGNEALVAATFLSLAQHFNDPSSATGREVELAFTARMARQEIIGTLFDPLLPSLDGEPLQLSDYRGKVVVMPFWAAGFPDSLQLIARLKAMEQANPDDVAVVGMNLDVEGVPVEQFLNEQKLEFPSFRAVSSPTTKVANPMAAKFGMVSMPFVAIINQEGRVASLNYTGIELEETVEQLIHKSPAAEKPDSESIESQN